MSRANQATGISLVHLALVMSTVCTLACAGIMSWFSRSDVTLMNAAQLLVDDLQQVQDTAAFERRNLSVRFLEDGQGYEALDEEGKHLPATIGAGPFLRRYGADGVFDGVKIESLDLGASDSITFTPTGETLQQGQIVLLYRGERASIRVSEGFRSLSALGSN